MSKDLLPLPAEYTNPHTTPLLDEIAKRISQQSWCEPDTHWMYYSTPEWRRPTLMVGTGTREAMNGARSYGNILYTELIEPLTRLYGGVNVMVTSGREPTDRVEVGPNPNPGKHLLIVDDYDLGFGAFIVQFETECAANIWVEAVKSLVRPPNCYYAGRFGDSKTLELTMGSLSSDVDESQWTGLFIRRIYRNARNDIHRLDFLGPFPSCDHLAGFGLRDAMARRQEEWQQVYISRNNRPRLIDSDMLYYALTVMSREMVRKHTVQLNPSHRSRFVKQFFSAGDPYPATSYVIGAGNEQTN